jgi:TolB protein
MLLLLIAAAMPPVMETEAAARNPNHWSGGRGEWVTRVLDESPTPSPDGKHLVFQSNRVGPTTKLWIADADGANARLLLEDKEDLVAPSFSPDGTKIAFAAHIDGETEIFVVNADGSGKRRITNWRGSDGHPHWSGDGQRIYFNSDRDTPDPSLPWERRFHDIYSVKADGSGLMRLTDCKAMCTFASPSPDGRHLAYRRVDAGPGKDWTQEDSARNSEVYVANIDGSNPRNVTNDPAFDGYPMWSPDSRWIVFASNRGGEVNVGHAFIMHPDGSGLRQVTHGWWSHVQPVFAPDGRSIYTLKNYDAVDWVIGSISRVPLP